MIVYNKDQELPALSLSWQDGTGALVDFSTGWTFTVKLADVDTPRTIAYTKTTGITGAATTFNYVIDWSVTDWSTLTADRRYIVWAYARRTSDTKDRVFNPDNPPVLLLRPAPA